MNKSRTPPHRRGMPQAAIEKLTDADAFRSLGLDRRQAWWEVPALQDKPTGIFTGQSSESTYESQMSLPLMTPAEHVVEDYAAGCCITPANELASLKNGATIKVAGLVLVRQRPGTASGICFITIEDETCSVNLVFSRNFLTNTERKYCSPGY